MQNDGAGQFERDLYCLQCAGFAVIPGFLHGPTLNTLARLSQSFEDEVERFVVAGGRAILRHSWPLRTTRALYAVAVEFQDLLMNATVQAFVRGYLGQAILRDCLVQTNMPDPRNAKRGVGGSVSFHRDTKWHDQAIHPMYLHVFLLLTDLTRENGATIVVPGTHRTREPGYYFKDTDPRTPQPGIDYRVYERRYFPSGVQLEAPRGSLLLLDPMTIHTQGINVTQEKRSLLNMAFRASGIDGTPRLLDARAIAERHARVPVRPDLLAILESNPTLPQHFGPLGNEWPATTQRKLHSR